MRHFRRTLCQTGRLLVTPSRVLGRDDSQRGAKQRAILLRESSSQSYSSCSTQNKAWTPTTPLLWGLHQQRAVNASNHGLSWSILDVHEGESAQSSTSLRDGNYRPVNLDSRGLRQEHPNQLEWENERMPEG